MSVKLDVKYQALIKHGDSVLPNEHYLEWTRQELARALQPVADMLNKRIRRLKSSDVFSPALISVMNNEVNGRKGEFKIRGLTKEQLCSEYMRMLHFYRLKTSTVRGSKEVQRGIEQKYFHGRKVSLYERKTLYEIFREVNKLRPRDVKIYGSDRLIQLIANEISAADNAMMSKDNYLDVDAIAKKVKEIVENEVDIALKHTVIDSFSAIQPLT